MINFAQKNQAKLPRMGPSSFENRLEFHATVLFLYSMETSENQVFLMFPSILPGNIRNPNFSDVSMGCVERDLKIG